MIFSSTTEVHAELTRLMEARNHQSHSLIEAANELLRQATEIDLSNLATEVLWKYPEAETIELIKDQRPGYESVIFCGSVQDEKGKGIERLSEAKDFVDGVLLDYTFSARDSIAERVINLREYADRKPSWYNPATAI